MPSPFRMTRSGSLRALLALRAKDSCPAKKQKHLVSSRSSIAPRLPCPKPTWRCSATEPGTQKACRPTPIISLASAALFTPFFSASAVPRV